MRADTFTSASGTWWRRPGFELKVVAVWLSIIAERMGMASDISADTGDNNFTVTSAEALGSSLNVGELIADILSLVKGDIQVIIGQGLE